MRSWRDWQIHEKGTDAVSATGPEVVQQHTGGQGVNVWSNGEGARLSGKGNRPGDAQQPVCPNRAVPPRHRIHAGPRRFWWRVGKRMHAGEEEEVHAGSRGGQVPGNEGGVPRLRGGSH